MRGYSPHQTRRSKRWTPPFACGRAKSTPPSTKTVSRWTSSAASAQMTTPTPSSSATRTNFWVAQARRASVLLDSPGFSAVIVVTNGTMARMDTVHPATFVAFKRWMAGQPDRDPLKQRRDVPQADAVQVLVDQYLPPG